MPDDAENLTQNVERADVSMLSETQRDMLWMRLRGNDVVYVFDGHDVTVSATRASLLTEAVAWVNREVRSPPQGYYPQPHPFQRTFGDGAVIAARWRRIAAAVIDSVVLGEVNNVVHGLGVLPWMLIVLDALYVISMTALWGRTLGKLAIGISVVDAARRGRPTWRQSAARWAASGGSASPEGSAAPVSIGCSCCHSWRCTRRRCGIREDVDCTTALPERSW